MKTLVTMMSIMTLAAGAAIAAPTKKAEKPKTSVAGIRQGLAGLVEDVGAYAADDAIKGRFVLVRTH